MLPAGSLNTRVGHHQPCLAKNFDAAAKVEPACRVFVHVAGSSHGEAMTAFPYSNRIGSAARTSSCSMTRL